MTNQYEAEQIMILEGLEAVRKRPGMYIGSTSTKGLHHLVWEIVDNCIDEYMAGFGKEVKVTIHPDQSITVSDEGRGIPVGLHAKRNMSTLEVVLTVLHAGGKFNASDSGYKTTGGLHGVGSSVVNALSEEMVAIVKRGGTVYRMAFAKGKTVAPLKETGSCPVEETGTTIWFRPDPLIFKETVEYDYKTIHNRLRESAMLNAGLSFRLKDEREEKPREAVFCFQDGLKDYVSFVNQNKTAIHEDIIHVQGEEGQATIEAAFQYSEDYSEFIYSYANNIRTPEGGVHETGFKTAISQAVKEYMASHSLTKESEPLASEDARIGLTAVISIKVANPEFEGQTKTKLGNTGIRPAIHRMVYSQFSRYLDEHPAMAKRIAEKVLKSHQERLILKRERNALREKNKTLSSSSTLPEKLADCQRKTPLERRELFLVEGDSAGGSAKQGRFSEFQAILPLRGKVLNVERAHLHKILNNEEIKGIVSAFGTGIGEDFDLEKRRYEKFIIMTDADVDGAHIRVLLLTFFYRYMRNLIEGGYIYIAQPPLYGLKKTANGSVFKYVQNDRELKLAKEAFPKAEIQRYKGLGEMNPKDLKETTMDPLKRELVRVTADDAMEADRTFDELMGKVPASRRLFIEENSHKANLDI